MRNTRTEQMFSAVVPTKDMGRLQELMMTKFLNCVSAIKIAEPTSRFIYFGFTRARRSSLRIGINGL